FGMHNLDLIGCCLYHFGIRKGNARFIVVQVCNGGVEGKIPFQEKSVGLTLLCDHGKSMIHCFLGTAEIHQLIVKVYPACCPCPDTEDGLQKLSTSGSHQTIKSENFTFPHIKGNILEMRFELCRQMLDRKDHV